MESSEKKVESRLERRTYWMGVVKAYEKSGLSQREFAKLRGEKAHLISQWRSRFLKEGILVEGELSKPLNGKNKSEEGLNFLSVELKDERAVKAAEPFEGSSDIEKVLVLIHKNGFKVEYVEHNNKGLMRKVLNLLLEVTGC